MNTLDAKRILETVLICAGAPLTIREMGSIFDGELSGDSIRMLLDEIATDWRERGIELVSLSTGWRLQSRPEMKPYLDRIDPERPPRYSRATMETLAIIAYRQPVTRGDVEDIRGVAVNTLTIKQLEDRGWVEVIGHRETPGRPGLYATTRQFLDDLGLASLEELPALADIDAGGALAERVMQQQGELLSEDEATDVAASESESAPEARNDRGGQTPLVDALTAAQEADGIRKEQNHE